MPAQSHATIDGARWAIAAVCLASAHGWAQSTYSIDPATSIAAPIAIVPFGTDSTATVTGALQVTSGKAIIAASGSIASGDRTTEVVLPHRGLLRVCAATIVKIAADASASAGQTPGLLLAVDHGAVEMSFATPRSDDTLLTPYFRITLSGSGSSEVKIRMGSDGDTCVDNAVAPASNASAPPANAPYVVVTSVFDSGLYRVEPGQRVMFQHGSLHEVVDNEKEPCGCPPALVTSANEFPLAQSEGLAPGPVTMQTGPAAQAPASGTLAYNGGEHAPQMVPVEPINPAPAAPTAKKKPGFLTLVKNFFRRIFGAE
jgi:hypothetical protein